MSNQEEVKKDIEKCFSIFKEVLSTEKGKKLMVDHTISFAVYTLIQKDVIRAVMSLIRNRSLQKDIDDIIFEIYNNKKENILLTTSDFIEVYLQFVLFVKHCSDYLKDKHHLSDIDSTNIDDINNAIGEMLDN